MLEIEAVTRMVLVSTPLFSNEGQVKTTSCWPLVVKSIAVVPPRAGVADTSVTLVDKILVTTTGCAATGPWLVTVTEYRSTPSEMTGLGVLVTQMLRSAVGTDILVWLAPELSI